MTRPAQQEVKAEIIKGLKAGYREYAAYLPLYNGVEFMRLVVAKGSRFDGQSPARETDCFLWNQQSRMGLVQVDREWHTAILGRRIRYPVVNLVFRKWPHGSSGR